MCNAGLSTGLQYERLLEEVIKYSNVVEIVMLPGKSYCFISCERIEYAEKIYQGLHGHCKLAQNNGVLYLSYCATGKYFICLTSIHIKVRTILVL